MKKLNKAYTYLRDKIRKKISKQFSDKKYKLEVVHNVYYEEINESWNPYSRKNVIKKNLL